MTDISGTFDVIDKSWQLLRMFGVFEDVTNISFLVLEVIFEDIVATSWLTLESGREDTGVVNLEEVVGVGVGFSSLFLLSPFISFMMIDSIVSPLGSPTLLTVDERTSSAAFSTPRGLLCLSKEAWLALGFWDILPTPCELTTSFICSTKRLYS